MKQKTIFLFLLFISLLTYSTAIKANVTMTYPFTDSMVVQRNLPLPIWGTASSGEIILVTFNNQTRTTQAASNGKWRVTFSPMIEKGPLTLTIQANNTVTLKDIYIGDVWQCAGQSNMDTRLSYYSQYADTIKNAKNPLLRFMDVRTNVLGNYKGWHAISPGTAGACSATGYFFGKAIQQKAGCAVGLLVTACGGTYVEAWLDPATIAANPGMVLPKGVTTSGESFNQFVAPVVSYGIKGTICMHGEQNAGDTITAPLYGERFKTMVKAWRKLWGQGDFPFYYGQITMFNGLAAPDTTSPIIQVREGQRGALSLPNSAMTVNVDIGAGGWHFGNKYEAGRRLSLFALAQDYGETSLVCSGPLYQSMGVQGNKVKLHFDYVGSGLKTRDGLAPSCFFVAGANNIWYPGTASIVDSTVVVYSASVPNPTKVCYAFGRTPTYNLFNNEGLPASQFNTELQSWPNGKINQILTLNESAPSKMCGSADFNVNATTNSGLRLNYETTNPNVATVDSLGKVHLVGIGTCKIKVFQRGNDVYRPSIYLYQTITVTKGFQTMKFDAIPSKQYGDSSFELLSTPGASGIPVVYTLTSGNAVSISGNVVTILKAGTVTIKASQDGNASYYASPPVSRNLEITKAPLTVTVMDTTRFLGTANPEFKLTYTGFVKTDLVDSLDTKPVINCSADISSVVGEYAISATGGVDNNYTFQYVDGKLNITLGTGIKDMKKQYSIYPVPVKDYLTIDVFEIADNLSVTIESIQGQKLLKKTIHSASAMKLDFTKFISGTYILKISKDSEKFVNKIIKL